MAGMEVNDKKHFKYTFKNEITKSHVVTILQITKMFLNLKHFDKSACIQKDISAYKRSPLVLIDQLILCLLCLVVAFVTN